MDTHGSLNSFRDLKEISKTQRGKHGQDKCFSHFVKDPDPTTNETLNLGPDPADKLRALANHLSTAERNETLSPTRKELAPWENPRIPSGYTYLAQMVAHDMVQTSLTNSRNSDQCETFHNHRAQKLNLDTLYGPHPRTAPIAYVPGKNGDTFRNRLRLGRMQLSKRGKERIGDLKLLPFRDIGRLGSPCGERGLTEPCLADARNDNNPILSQLITVFSHLHNGIIDRLEKIHPAPERPPAPTPSDRSQFLVWEEDIFSKAREIVTKIYLDVVENDLMRLLLQPDVFKHYSAKRVGFLHKNPNQIPLEFSHAAFRFGHAMIRPEYFMGARFTAAQDQGSVLLFNSHELPKAMPFDERWIIDWSDFFDLGIQTPRNYSGRISPYYSGNIKPPNGLSAFEHSLAMKDLLRSATSKLWSIHSLVELIRKGKPKLFADDGLYGPDNRYRNEIENWFLDRPNSLGDIHPSIKENPPLSFYVLLEAQIENEGIRLGTIGSILVAESVFSAIRQRRAEFDLDEIKTDMEKIFGTGRIDSMPELLRAMAPMMAPHSLFVL